VAWFKDLYKRGLLDLAPPYQRRSVWNQRYREEFIDTILLEYPSPAIFLYEQISPQGDVKYAVVDGKQRLMTVLDFTDNEFPVGEMSAVEALRGLYFEALDSDVRQEFWTYQFSVEYLPTTDEGTLNNIFNRINKNVAKLTQQELRHAKFSGLFVEMSERLTGVVEDSLPGDFPRIASASRRQMKDVELVSQLLLLIEEGVRSYNQIDLDSAYADRDETWENASKTESEFRAVIGLLSELPPELLNSSTGRRLKNQADFYSLFGAYLELKREGSLPSAPEQVARLSAFMEVVGHDASRVADKVASRYFDAARSASNDMNPRRLRIDTVKRVLTGEWPDAGSEPGS
jgi:hypothetical protein